MPQSALQDDRWWLGALLVTLSAAMFGLAGVLTKSIVAETWTIACWRGLIGGLLIAIYVTARRGDDRVATVLRIDRRCLLIAGVGAAASVAFIGAFKHTYVANVTLIYASVPFAAAILERWVLAEPLRLGTMVAAAGCFAGVMVMVSGGLGTGQLLGNGLALLMMLGCALYMVLIRMFRETGVVWAAAVSGFLLFATAWLFADPTVISFPDFVLTIIFGLSFAVAVILWTEGTKLISAAESGLFGTSEILFAIAFAWLLLGEVAPMLSMAGGAVILLSVLIHSIVGYREVARASDSAAGAQKIS